MERNLSVNAGHVNPAGEVEQLLSASAPPQLPKGDLGPCLYLGEAGQRCSRRAVENGFCRVHQGERDHLDPEAQASGGTSARIAARSKVLAAIIGLVGILLPYVFDLTREILRWIHAH
jgi:hypothetical protein